MTALLGTFVKLSTMADGTPRIVLDLQCTLADIAAMGLMPGIPFGIARITGESTIALDLPDPVASRPGELCIMACTFCKDKRFWDWFESCTSYSCKNEEDAKCAILDICVIESRKELDIDKTAGTLFHTLIREPYMKWRTA